MDSRVDRIGSYRELLQRPLSWQMRRTLEWLLVDATRDRVARDLRSRPWDRYPAPKLVAIADEAVAEAARVMRSQFATMQLYVAAQDTLLLLACRNFDAGFVGQFACLRPDGRTICSRVLASAERVILEDVEQDPAFAPHAPAALTAGFRALQATPLMAESGKPIGVLTTHFAAPRAFSNDEFGEMDALGRRVSAELARACG